MSKARKIEIRCVPGGMRMMVEGSCATPGKSRNEEEERYGGLSSGEEERMREIRNTRKRRESPSSMKNLPARNNEQGPFSINGQ